MFLWIIVVCSAVGWANACVFTLMIAGRLAVDSPLAQKVCRLDTRDCEKVISSRNARLLGMPNSAVGLVWYAVAGGWAGLALISGTLPFREMILGLSALSVLLGLYLSWSLMFRLKVVCKFCYLGHFMNLLIFLSLLALQAEPLR